MEKDIIVSAPGKLFLLGEHVAVYGKPAILGSVAKRCYVTLSSRNDSLIEVTTINFAETITISEDTLLAKTVQAQKQWEEFKATNNPTLLRAITSNVLDYPIICIGESLRYYGKKIPRGFTLTIDSEVSGSGMGSSASLAVATAGAITLFLKEQFNKERINEIALQAEKKKHGFPSGADSSTCCYGGLVWYRKETNDLQIITQIPFSLSHDITKNFFTIFTGMPKESTGEMVSAVRSLYIRRTSYVEKILADQEQVTKDLLTALKNSNSQDIINTITKGEKNLEKLGVVSPLVKKLIRAIEKTGGAAKICGGGGKQDATGTVLIYHANIKTLESILQAYRFSHSPISLGVEGVKEHMV